MANGSARRRTASRALSGLILCARDRRDGAARADEVERLASNAAILDRGTVLEGRNGAHAKEEGAPPVGRRALFAR
jgi:hypothetical protein